MIIKVEKKKLYSVEDLNKLLPITPLTIRKYFKKGKIKGHKISKNWYMTRDNLEVFLGGTYKKTTSNNPVILENIKYGYHELVVIKGGFKA